MTNVITGNKITGTQTSTEDNLAGQCDAHATHPFKMALRTPGLAVPHLYNRKDLPRGFLKNIQYQQSQMTKMPWASNCLLSSRPEYPQEGRARLLWPGLSMKAGCVVETL